MMVKTNNGYLDFDDTIEVERQVKLFEEIETTDGDYSYQFSAPKTSNNLRILGFPFPDNKTKLVYQQIEATLLSDDGLEVYRGFLRIEGITNVIYLSFFSGNNNWFGMLSGQLSELDFSSYDVDQTQSNIQAAIFNTEGTVFPLVDNGGLLTRGYPHVKVEDFVAGIYVKDVFKRIFSTHGIKIQGELLEDPNYTTAITMANGKNQAEIDSRSSYVHTSFSARPAQNTVYKTVFDDDTNFPYFDGSLNNYDLPNSKYVADVKMVVKVDLALTMSFSGGSMQSVMYFYVNGVSYVQKVQDSTSLLNQSIAFTAFIPLEAGDELEVYTEYVDLFAPANNDIIDGTVRIVPTYIYRAFGNSIVPRWTQGQYVSNILRLFNVLTHYQPASKTLTFNIFEKIKSKVPLDISEYISENEVDYIDFIQNYGKKSNFVFQEADDEDLKLSRNNYIKFAKGSIDVDNEFLKDSVDVLESDFTASNTYIHPVFDMSMEKTDIIQLDTDITVEATGVTDSLGQARFAIPTDEFVLSDLVRIDNSTNSAYNGDWMVESVGAGWVEFSGLAFDTNATAELTKLLYVYTENDDVFLFHQVPLYPVTNFSGVQQIRLENTDLETMAIAFFNLLSTGRQVNIDFVNSLSFYGSDNPSHYQKTLIEQYFNLFSGILNDPVKLKPLANLPYNVFLNIDFLRPITIKTLETSNMYYLNRITGYEASEKQCILELIKLANPERSSSVVIPNVTGPEIIQAEQIGIANGNVMSFSFAPLTVGSKMLFVGMNVANGTVTGMSVSETASNPNMANIIDSGTTTVYATDGTTEIGYFYFYVIDITDTDSTFEFTFADSDANTHYSAGFGIEIAAGAEWDASYLGLTDPATGYDDSAGAPMFTTGTSLSSVPDVITPQARNLFITWGFSMGLSPGGNGFQAPFNGLNPSGDVSPSGVLMGFDWNAVEIPTATNSGPLVFETTGGISGVRQWLSWGNFYIP